MIGNPDAQRWARMERGETKVCTSCRYEFPAADIHDGHNVVYHEFAHQLDTEYGGADGAPKLERRSMYVAWARVFGQEYEALVRSVIEGRPALLDAYGATKPAEFFAVATEFFFERPVELKALHPALNKQMAAYFKRDPAAHCG